MAIQPLPGVAVSGVPPAGDLGANACVTGQFTAVGPGKAFAFYGPFNLLIYNTVTTGLTTTNGSTAATAVSGTGISKGDAINSPSVPLGTTVGAITGTAITLALPSYSQYGTLSTAANIISGLTVTNGLVGSAVTGTGIPAGTTVTGIQVPAVAATNQSPAQLGTVLISNAPTINTLPNYPAALTFALTGNAVTTGAAVSSVFTSASAGFVGTVQLERSFDGGATWICCNIGGAGLLAQWSTGNPVSTVVGECERGMVYRLNCIAYTSGTINYRLSTTGAAALSLAVASSI